LAMFLGRSAPGIVEVIIKVTDKPRTGNIEFSSPYAGTAKWAP